MLNMKKLIIALFIPLAAAIIGSLATTPNLDPWYAGLIKPPFNPPNWLFAPVWTFLYVLMGLSLYLAWTERTPKKKEMAYWWFGIQLTLNALWSLVFFGLHALSGGLVVILLLWISIAATIKKFWHISPTAAYLLVPYIAWVTFATILNAALLALNG